MDTKVTFIAGTAYANNRLFIAGSPDSDPPYSPYSVWYTYIGDDATEPWTHFVARWWAVAACVYRPHRSTDWALVAMSNEGDCDFTFENGQLVEKIPEAGVHSARARHWGYVNDLCQIGNHLYACGDGGQVYKRVGPDRWEHIDDGLLQHPDVSERLMLSAIDGPHENAIYAVGSFAAPNYPPRVHFSNGRAWRQLDLPAVAERITNIHVESEARIWLCGANGTLLLGNAHDGFRSLSTTEDNQLFYSLCLYEGVVFLGSNLGLYAYDPADHRKGIRRVITGLSPEVEDANIVDAVDGALWSIGEKDIVRYDGEKWERIDHPDNPPIR